MSLVATVRSRFTRDAADASGDNDWLQALYAEYAGSLCAFVMRLTAGNRQLAEDIMQETLLRAWRNSTSLRGDIASLRPWLFTVARRMVISEHRRRSARPLEVEPEFMEFVGVDDEVDSLLISVVVADALRALSDKHRAVVRELYFRGSNTEQAALALGIPKGTVLSRSYYALRALRLALAERGITQMR